MSAKGLRVGHFRLYVRFKASVRAKSLLPPQGCGPEAKTRVDCEQFLFSQSRLSSAGLERAN